MAAVTVTVPDAMVPRVVEALRGAYPSLTNGMTDAQAAKAVLRQLLRETVVAYETQKAQRQVTDAVANAETAARTDMEAIT